MKNPHKADIELDRAFTHTPTAFSNGVRSTLASLPHQAPQHSRPPIRRALLLTALLVVCLAGAAVAAQMTGLLNLFLSVEPSAQPLIRTNVAEAVREDCAAQIREVIWDGETLGLVYVVTDPALEQVEGFKPPESGEVRLSSQLDRYGFQHMAEEIQVGDGRTIPAATMDVRWGDTHDQVVYYLEAALPIGDQPYEIALQPYCSKGTLPMGFTLAAPNAQDVRDFILPEPALFDGFTVRVTRHRETPLRVYVDLEVRVTPEVSPEIAAHSLNRWGQCALVGSDGNVIPMQGTSAPDEPFGYAATVTLVGKADEDHKGSWRMAPMDDDGQALMTETITLSDTPLQ